MSGVNFTRESAKRIASAVRAVEASPVDLGSFRRRSRTVEAEASSGVDYSDFTFGFSINGKVVTVKAGGVYHGKRTLWYNAPDTPITITADYQYIWVEYTIGGGYAKINGPSTILPLTDATYYRCWLHQFRYQNSVASLYRIGHLGNIELPGVFA